MGDVRAWILGICFAGMACSILDMIYPNGNMEKSIKLVTAVFFLCAVVVPAADHLGHFNLELTQQTSAQISASEDLEEEVNQQVLKVAQINMEAAVRSLIQDQFSVKPLEILVTMDTREDGSIQMECIEILLTAEDKEKSAEIQRYIAEQTGIQPEMYTA